MADSEGEHTKTVYAEFGFAVSEAQTLEHGIVIALAYVDLFSKNSGVVNATREERIAQFDKFMGGSFEQTLGVCRIITGA